MKYKVVRKQQNSRKCIVCGLKNELGLKASFFEMENGELIALFKPVEEHQSYPERLHGGMAAAILDETIGRAIMMTHQTIWGVTVELSLRYKKPVPLDCELRVIGRITKDTSRLFEGTGEILLPTGEVAVSATGRYMKMPIEKIADFKEEHQEWFVLNREDDPVEIELP